MSSMETGEADIPQSFLVVLDGVTHRVSYTAGDTLLDCILAAGLDAPYLCQEGHCGTCMSVLRHGQVVMRANLVLSERDLEAGYVLACQSIPVNDTELLLDMDD